MDLQQHVVSKMPELGADLTLVHTGILQTHALDEEVPVLGAGVVLQHEAVILPKRLLPHCQGIGV